MIKNMRDHKWQMEASKDVSISVNSADFPSISSLQLKNCVQTYKFDATMVIIKESDYQALLDKAEKYDRIMEVM